MTTRDHDQLTALRERVAEAEASGNLRSAMRAKARLMLATTADDLAPNGVPTTRTERN